MFQCPHDEIMPVLSCSYLDIYPSVLFLDDFLAMQGNFNDKSFVWFREQDIRSTTQDQMGLGSKNVS